MTEQANFLLITWDSCRADSVRQATTPVLDAVVAVKTATAHGTFTYPAHMAMYQGILPHVGHHRPYYNRYVLQLVKIAREGAPPGGAVIEFPPGTPDIIRGFSAVGYATMGWGAVGWFRHHALQEPFGRFQFTGIHASHQVADFVSCTTRLTKPFFAFINFGETHYPYMHGENRIDPPLLSPARRPVPQPGEFDREGWLAQVECCEFLDARMGELISHLRGLPRPTIVIFAGDHGECFGEDGLVGHGFYHRKVMDVPIGIFEINGDWLCWGAFNHLGGDGSLKEVGKAAPGKDD